MVKFSQKCFLLDYGFGDLTIQMLEDGDNLNKQTLFINNLYKNNEKKVVFVSQKRFFELCVEHKDLRIFIGCDSKKNADLISAYLTSYDVNENDI